MSNVAYADFRKPKISREMMEKHGIIELYAMGYTHQEISGAFARISNEGRLWTDDDEEDIGNEE